jgi:hypothetical protein
MREGFSEGCRNRALRLYVIFMLKNGYGEHAILENANRFAGECHPRLTEQEKRGCIESAKNAKRLRHRITNQTIADWLNILPEESAKLESWGPASRFLPAAGPAKGRASRTERIKARRNTILLTVEQASHVPSVREMVTILSGKYEISVSHVTVEADYRALGLVSTIQRKRREREDAIATQLPFQKPTLERNHAE